MAVSVARLLASLDRILDTSLPAIILFRAIYPSPLRSIHQSPLCLWLSQSLASLIIQRLHLTLALLHMLILF